MGENHKVHRSKILSCALFTDKITAIAPMAKVDGQIYEYACHEGNHGMVNILRGERMAEQRASEAGN